MMKSLVLLFFTLLTAILYGQETNREFDGHNWQAPYTLPAPKDWAIERFLIPISFAPQITYKGVEDIRFAPGWSKANSDEYWSYAFLWYLEGTINTNAEMIAGNLKAYYTGLIKVNGSNITAEKIIPVKTVFKEAKKDRGDFKSFTGTINMLDYMTQKPITLNCKAHLKYCQEENKTFLFFELSPQSFSHPVWQSLDQLWFDLHCKKE